jgi:vacuolar-type H+-ATPase catalytic subunit A/Vma1
MNETLDKATGLQEYTRDMRKKISELYEKTVHVSERVTQAVNEAESIKEVAKRAGSDANTAQDAEKRITEAEVRINALIDSAAERFATHRNGAILKRRKGETEDE